MKKNDFDFIRDKIDQSGVNAPDHMDEDFVMKQLEGVRPDTSAPPKVVELQPKKHHYKLISGIAAAVVAVFTLSIFGVMYFSRNNKPAPSGGIASPGGIVAPSVKSDIPLKSFSSYDEVKAQMKETEGKQYSSYGYRTGSMTAVEDYEAAASPDSNSSGSSSNSSSGSDSYSETYKQVEGVDEADIVKTDGKYIYIVENGSYECIKVYSATDSPELVAVIFPESFSSPTATPDQVDTDDEDELDVFVEEMFLRDGKLIVVCMTRGQHFTYNTMAAVYDVTDIDNITLADQFHQSGYYTTSRMIGDTLYLISEHSVYSAEDFEIPVCYHGAEADDIPIDCVYSVEDPTENDMLIIGGYGLSDGASEVQSSAIIGSVEDVYCNESNMYLYSTRWHYEEIVDYEIYEESVFGDAVDSYVPREYEPITTAIYKVSLTDGIAFTAYGEIEGWLDSRYSMDEKDGYLRVAATTENAVYIESNSLYILDSDLNTVGSVTGFAENESIKAVRYVGDTAYVITYEQTDPLFVIDVSDPENPVILGEAKIDGFSSMLVPINENTVLGLGYYTEDASYTSMQVQRGFKLALFDVSDKLNPKVLDEKVYRNYYSTVMTEPRALVVNPDRGDYLIPLNFEDYHIGSNIEYYMPDIRGGALNFTVQDGKIVELNRYEVNTGNSDADLIDRCLYVGDNIYMISNGYYQDTNLYTAKY